MRLRKRVVGVGAAADVSGMHQRASTHGIRISEPFEREHRLPMTAGDDRSPRDGPGCPEAARKAPTRPVRVQVSQILGGGREAILEHDGQDYRLRITSNGKLILTK